MTGRIRTFVAAASTLLFVSQNAEPVHGDQRDPGVRLVPVELHFGPLRVGARAEAGASVFIEVDGKDHELTARVVPPPFLNVKSLRVRERESGGKPTRFIELGFSLDTTRAAELAGNVRIEYGGRRVELPVKASVLPGAPGLKKVLVITPHFGAAGDIGYYLPWFKLVQDARIDVNYIDPSWEGLPFRDLAHDQQGLPEWFKAFDVILLVDGGPSFINRNDALTLRRYVRTGGRLVVGASGFMGDSVPRANRILEPFGLEMEEEEEFADNFPQRDKDGYRSVMHYRPKRDALTEGVQDVAFSRVSFVRVTDDRRGSLLVRDRKSVERGFAGISRDGGEVIALGPSLLFSWIDEQGGANDNLALLRNLLTKPRPGKAGRDRRNPSLDVEPHCGRPPPDDASAPSSMRGPLPTLVSSHGRLTTPDVIANDRHRERSRPTGFHGGREIRRPSCLGIGPRCN